MYEPLATLRKTDPTKVKCPRANNTCRGILGTLVLTDEGPFVDLLQPEDVHAMSGWVRTGAGVVQLCKHAQRQYDAGRMPRARRDLADRRHDGTEPMVVAELYDPTRVRCPRCGDCCIIDPVALARSAAYTTS